MDKKCPWGAGASCFSNAIDTCESFAPLFASSGDELLLTEMIFNGLFNDLTVEQATALLSCFVFQENVRPNARTQTLQIHTKRPSDPQPEPRTFSRLAVTLSLQTPGRGKQTDTQRLKLRPSNNIYFCPCVNLGQQNKPTASRGPIPQCPHTLLSHGLLGRADSQSV